MFLWHVSFYNSYPKIKEVFLFLVYVLLWIQRRHDDFGIFRNCNRSEVDNLDFHPILQRFGDNASNWSFG